MMTDEQVEREFERQFVEALAKMDKRYDQCELKIKTPLVVINISLLQLAIRHPGVTENLRKHGKSIADQMIAWCVKHAPPEDADIVAAGLQRGYQEATLPQEVGSGQ